MRIGIRGPAILTGAVLTALGKAGQRVPFTKGEDGLWTLTVGRLEPDMYAYCLLVDGVRIADRIHDRRVYRHAAIPPPGSAGQRTAYYDARIVPQGAVTRHVYHSNVRNGEGEPYVYTAAAYDRSRRYPVLYLSAEVASWRPTESTTDA